MPNTVPCRRFLPFPVFPTFLSQRKSECIKTEPGIVLVQYQFCEGYVVGDINDVFVHVLVLLAAGFALCFGKSINLT
jgi:hypothetical protein